jgi:hypothetical protein
VVDGAVEVGLVGESDVGGESGEVGFAVCETFKGEAGAEAYPVAGDRVTGGRVKDSAQVVRRDAQKSGEFGERAPGVGGERLTGCVYHDAAGANGRGSSGRYALWVDVLERPGEE